MVIVKKHAKAEQTVSIKTCFAFELGKNSQLLIYRKILTPVFQKN